MAQFTLQVVTPERVAYKGEITALIIPGAAGYLGVWAHHAPLLTTLREGTMTVQICRGELHHYQIRGGLLEVRNNTATVLVDELVQAD